MLTGKGLITCMSTAKSKPRELDSENHSWGSQEEEEAIIIYHKIIRRYHNIRQITHKSFEALPDHLHDLLEPLCTLWCLLFELPCEGKPMPSQFYGDLGFEGMHVQIVQLRFSCIHASVGAALWHVALSWAYRTASAMLTLMAKSTAVAREFPRFLTVRRLCNHVYKASRIQYLSCWPENERMAI
jgi:hypothetical protein